MLVHMTSGLKIRSPLSSTHCQLGWKPCLLNLALEGGSMETGTSSQMNGLEFFPFPKPSVLVIESPVRSGYLPFLALTETITS